MSIGNTQTSLHVMPSHVITDAKRGRCGSVGCETFWKWTTLLIKQTLLLVRVVSVSFSLVSRPSSRIHDSFRTVGCLIGCLLLSLSIGTMKSTVYCRWSKKMNKSTVQRHASLSQPRNQNKNRWQVVDNTPVPICISKHENTTEIHVIVQPS